MSTFTSFYIYSSDLIGVTNKLQSLTNISSFSKKVEIPKEFKCKRKGDDNAKPNSFLIFQFQPNWIIVQHNGFKNLDDWMKEMSKFFKTKVINIAVQSNVDFYHFSLFENGKLIRKIEYCYGADYEPTNKGQKFEFENAYFLSKNIEDLDDDGDDYDNDDEFDFDFDDIEYFALQFDLDINTAITKNIEFILLSKKPWWKFWSK